MSRRAGESRKLAIEPLYEYALRALGRRALTKLEVEAKLLSRCADEQDVPVVVERLRAHGYLNDEQVAESHSALRREVALVGRKRVLGELRRRGVNQSMAENAVVAAYAESDEAALAKEFLRRRLGSRFDEEPISDRKELTRLFRSLARAGYELSTIAHVLGEVTSDSEWLDALTDASASDSS